MPEISGIYSEIRSAYYRDIWQAMSEYLNAPAKTRVTRPKNTYKRAINQAFFDAFEEGYQSGGADLPLDGESFAWIKARVQQEFDYVGGLFERLRDEIKPEGTTESMALELDARAEGYAQTLDGIFSMGKMRGAGDVALTMVGADGEEHCETCAKYKGQTHPASWWVKNDLVPYPGNTAFVCKGYQCQHYLQDKFGKMFTL